MTRWPMFFFIVYACKTPIEADIDSSPKKSCDITAQFTSDIEASSIEIAGSFNNWEPQPLTEKNGQWERWLGELQPGLYPYKFVIDDVWEEPPADVPTAWEGGFENRLLKVEDCQQPSLEPLSVHAAPNGSVQAKFLFKRSASGASIDQMDASIGVVSVESQFDKTTGQISLTTEDLPPGKHSIRITVADTEGKSVSAFLPVWVEAEPFKWQSGILYYVFLDRFADGGSSDFPTTNGASFGADWLGGDLVGAKQKLEQGYFDELGVTSIWLSPVNDNPEGAFIGSGGYYYTGYHGYWPTEPRTVEPRLGTTAIPADQALHEFIEAAHARGIRVLLDVVLNHVHEQHRYLQEHPEWFSATACICTNDSGACNWDTNPIGCWFTNYLPDLDYRQPELVEAQLADLQWWIETFDVDGFRVDAAKHMDHVILRQLALNLDRRYETVGGAPFYLVGETFTGTGGQSLIMDYVAPWELDGQFEFPLLYPIRDVFAHDASFHILAQQMDLSDLEYGDDIHGMSPFLGNHDVSRFATEMTGCDEWALFEGCSDFLAMNGNENSDFIHNIVAHTELAFAFVFTQPGVPLLYYGDEIGLAGAGDPDNRRLMLWDGQTTAQQELHQRVQALATLRNEEPSLHIGDRTILKVEDDLLVYGRVHENDVAIVALYKGDEPITVDIPVPTGWNLEGQELHRYDISATQSVNQGHLSLELDPLSWQVWIH